MSREFDFIVTSTGKRFYFDDIESNIIDIEDIATALSRICRFAGHCSRFYSVAEHSMFVSSLLPDELKIAGLLHDATEAYLGDITRPLKAHLKTYKEIEDKLHKHIESVFGISFDDPRIKEADNIALLAEAKNFYEKEDLSIWGINVDDFDCLKLFYIPPFDSNPRDVKERFLWEYHQRLHDIIGGEMLMQIVYKKPTSSMIASRKKIEDDDIKRIKKYLHKKYNGIIMMRGKKVREELSPSLNNKKEYHRVHSYFRNNTLYTLDVVAYFILTLDNEKRGKDGN